MTSTVRRPARRRPVVPPPKPVTQRDETGRRFRAPLPPSDWPYPPDGRPRFAHHRLAEEHHGGMGVTYRTYVDGHVVAYGRAQSDGEPPAPDPNAATRTVPYRDWVAVVWTAHPLLSPRRAHVVRHLLDRATFQEVVAAVDAWEREGP